MRLPSPLTSARFAAGCSAVALLAVGLAAGCSDSGTTEPQPCESACADGNPCTLDRCIDGECVSEPTAAGLDCSDGDACNGVEACDGEGSCAAGVSLITNDGDTCTADGCDPATGTVSHVFEADCVAWTATSEAGAPTARVRHTAVWTGSRMLVWGGSVNDVPSVTASGAAYDPVGDGWTPISEVGAPSARHSHTALWTGDKMLVWGGYSTLFENSGALYDPVSDSWQTMTTVGAPSGRNLHAAAWTGTRFVVHGGLAGSTPLGDGGQYDPARDVWEPLTAGGPSPRFSHSVVASGDALLFFGGTNLFDWLADGSQYDPSAGSWSALDTVSGPSLREQHRALWTGSAMLVWGGWNGGSYLNDGGIFDPLAAAGERWTAVSDVLAPAARTEHVALWTGEQMFVWGGCGADGCSTVYGDGALLRLQGVGGTWDTLPNSGAPAARRGAEGVFTGSEAIVWGGRIKNGTYLASGGRARLVR